jgi:hypothetical protein
MLPLPTLDDLDAVTIPVTCPVPWDTMRGDYRTRFCDRCRQHVHDISELTRAEAVRLITGWDTLPCLRLYRRQDGQVMTADCLGRRERVWKWMHRRAPLAAGLFALVFFAGCGGNGNKTFQISGGGPRFLPPPPDAAQQCVAGVGAVEAVNLKVGTSDR